MSVKNAYLLVSSMLIDSSLPASRPAPSDSSGPPAASVLLRLLSGASSLSRRLLSSSSSSRPWRRSRRSRPSSITGTTADPRPISPQREEQSVVVFAEIWWAAIQQLGAERFLYASVERPARLFGPGATGPLAAPQRLITEAKRAIAPYALLRARQRMPMRPGARGERFAVSSIWRSSRALLRVNTVPALLGETHSAVDRSLETDTIACSSILAIVVNRGRRGQVRCCPT